jgi:hypothetical protein
MDFKLPSCLRRMLYHGTVDQMSVTMVSEVGAECVCMYRRDLQGDAVTLVHLPKFSSGY